MHVIKWTEADRWGGGAQRNISKCFLVGGTRQCQYHSLLRTPVQVVCNVSFSLVLNPLSTRTYFSFSLITKLNP